jgi:hypothetical protein
VVGAEGEDERHHERGERGRVTISYDLRRASIFIDRETTQLQLKKKKNYVTQ